MLLNILTSIDVMVQYGFLPRMNASCARPSPTRPTESSGRSRSGGRPTRAGSTGTIKLENIRFFAQGLMHRAKFQRGLMPQLCDDSLFDFIWYGPRPSIFIQACEGR